jgi:Zn-dependent protease with chaperone function
MVRSLYEGCLSYPDAIFFDVKYHSLLLPEEILAVGAHEYFHIIERHGMKRFARVFAPAAIIGTILGLLTFTNHGLISQIDIFNQMGNILSSICIASVSFLLLLLGLLYMNAGWNRQQETQSDLAAVKFADGEALISALIKLDKLRPRKISQLERRILPKTYPSLDKRITDIRTAMNKTIAN